MKLKLGTTWIMVLAFTISACETDTRLSAPNVSELQVQEQLNPDAEIMGFDDIDHLGQFKDASQGCYEDRFNQPTPPQVKGVDILFVTDTSGSLDRKREHVADSIEDFVGQLPAGMDFQAAVMLAHGSRSCFSGRLWSRSGHGPVLSSKKMPVHKLREQLEYLLTHVEDDIYSDGGEEGMYSFYHSMDGGALFTSRAKGFFRKDAALVVIFVADENDICAVYPAGVKRVPDPENIELKAKARDCAGIDSTAILKRVQALQGDRPYLIGAIVHNDLRTTPHRGQEEYGYGYMDLVQAAHGISVDISAPDFRDGLAKIGQLANSKIMLKNEFVLSGSGFNPATIEVRVDGRSVPFSYESELNRVVLSDAGIPGSQVQVTYCGFSPVTPSPTPTPTHSPTPSPTPSATPSATPSPTPSATPSATPAPTPSTTPSATPAPTPTPSTTPSATPDPTPSATPSAAPSATPDPTPCSSPSPTPPPCNDPSCGGGIGV